MSRYSSAVVVESHQFQLFVSGVRAEEMAMEDRRRVELAGFRYSARFNYWVLTECGNEGRGERLATACSAESV